MKKVRINERGGVARGGEYSAPLRDVERTWKSKFLAPFTEPFEHENDDINHKLGYRKRIKIKRPIDKFNDNVNEWIEITEDIISEDLAVWFGKKNKKKGSSQPKGPWVNICKKKKGGGHPPCGRTDSDKGGYPVCRGAGVAGKMSQKEKDSACRRKRNKEKKDTQKGKGQKPTRIKVKNYKKESIDKNIVKNILKEYVEIKRLNETDIITKNVSPSNKVIKNICDVKNYCDAQGPITFGQLREIVKVAKNKRLGYHIGEGGFKAFIRLLPWFFPQIAIAGMIGSGMRAFNKILKPTLKETPTYKSWWSKTIIKLFGYAEGDIINTGDPLSKIFFISDGLMNLMNEENKLKFAFHIADIAEGKEDSEPVPEFFVENELRSWINQRFLLDPPLGQKELKSFKDVTIPTNDDVSSNKEEVINKLTENILRKLS